MGKFSNWSKEQDSILLRVIQTTQSKKWIKASRKLKQKHFIHTPSECRERFINYLAPDIDKSEITQEELDTLYEQYQKIGPKWSIIQQYIKSKTQCKIKNVFYGNVKNLLKTTYKFFTFKTAPFINNISTDYLQAIYDGDLGTAGQGIREVKDGIRVMQYRNNKVQLLKYIQTHQEDYLKLINTVLKEVFKKDPIRFQFSEQEHSKKINKLLRNEKKLEASNGVNREARQREVSDDEDDEAEQFQGQKQVDQSGSKAGLSSLIKVQTEAWGIKLQNQESILSPEIQQNMFSLQPYHIQENISIPYITFNPYYPFIYYPY